MPRIVLFDIDMTLIRSQRGGRLAIDRAFERLYGVPNALDGIRVDGRTDYGIFMEVIETHDVAAGRDPLDVYRELTEAYLEELVPALADRSGEVMPGIWPLLDALDRSHRAVGLATGNMRRGAKLKLAYFGLWDRFPGGGFGDATPIRAELVNSGIVELAAHLGVVADPADAVIIGDTPLDVEAAHITGARALAVATGSHSVEELEATGAEWVLADLADVDRVLAILRS